MQVLSKSSRCVRARPATARRRPLHRLATTLIIIVLGLAYDSIGAQVVINEILATNTLTNVDEFGDSSDWVELANVGTDAIDLAGFGLTDNLEDVDKWVFPPLLLSPGEYALVWCSGKDLLRASPKDLTTPDSRFGVEPRYVGPDAEWRYLAVSPESGSLPTGWEQTEFDDSAWPLGHGGFGFGTDGIDTESIDTALPEGITVALLRHSFSAEDPSAIDDLILESFFDDGFVLFLNGTLVQAVNFDTTEPLDASSRSQRSHSELMRERYDLTPWRHLIRTGTNQVAVALLNLRASSSDMFLRLHLGAPEALLHTSFKLSSDGESVALSDPSGQVVDSVEFPFQTRDQSFGRAPDGTGSFVFNLEPSPHAANSGPTGADPLTTPSPVFSVERGFHDSPFEVTITASSLASQIRFTLDGTAPSDSEGEPYTGPVHIESTTTLRAVAYANDRELSRVTTHSYVFLADVVQQPELHTEFTEDPDRRDRILRALTAAPSVFLSANAPLNVTDEVRGSIEFLLPDGSDGVQIDGGLAYVGGHSAGAFPKKNIRLYFRGRYGATRLEYPIFRDTRYGDSAAQSFRRLQLHSGSHDSLFYLGARNQPPSDAQYLRNPFMYDAQFEMGNLSLHSRFVHVYLNGTYWGHYNLIERPHPAFLADYLGGEEEDYEAINKGVDPVGSSAPAWEHITASVSDFEESKRYVDMGNFVDYNLLNFYAGNDWDWNPNQNWMGGGPRAPDSGGYKFFSWDSDIIFRLLEDNSSNNGGPGNLFGGYLQNDEFRELVATRIHRHFFDDGLLTPAGVRRIYDRLAAEVESTLAPEPARWQWTVPWSIENQWAAEQQRLRENFFPQRTRVVIDQLRQAGWYPEAEAPRVHPNGGVLAEDSEIFLSALEGVIYYTTDGTDPRLPGGALSPNALTYEVPRRTLVDHGSPARFLVPTDNHLGLEWTRLDFDDSLWQPSSAAIGFDRTGALNELIQSDIGADLDGVAPSVFLRIPFEVDDASRVLLAGFSMNYDDGYVVYLNGEPIVSRNAPAELTWDSIATANRRAALALSPETEVLRGTALPLRSGTNVLAIHGLNRAADNRDFLFAPALTVAETAAPIIFEESLLLRARTRVDEAWSALHEAPFVAVSPLVITEILFRPMPFETVPPEALPFEAGDYEFVELRNVSQETVDLQEFSLEGGLRFSFDSGAVARLEPGECVLVVSHLEAFQTRYDTLADGARADNDLRVAGVFDGQLNNGGDSIALVDGQGRTRFSVEYGDNWYPLTDGGGHSLVLKDEREQPLEPNSRQTWRPSQNPGGSPGTFDRTPGGHQRPGDVDQDGRVNLTDAVSFLRILFGGRDTLPCGSSVSDRGTHQVLDLNGDDRLDIGDVAFHLEFLFRRGAPPALGLECTPMLDCPDSCRP